MARAKKSSSTEPESSATSTGGSNVFYVSQSKVKTWRRCHYAYHLRYVENLRPKKVSRPLQFGRLVHEAIEKYANGDDWQEALDVEANTPELEEILETARIVMTEYFEHWPEKSLVYVRMNGKAAEHEFQVEISDGIVAKGKIDAFAKAKGMRWLVEHKTFSKMMNDDHRWRNLQSSVYIRVVDILGWKPVEGTIWDNIRSKPPMRPEVLKSGKLSQRQLDTLPTAVLETLNDLGLNPRDYEHLLEGARQNRGEYFKRIFNPTKPQVVDILFADFIETAREMSERHGKSKVKSIENHCDWCDFEPICRAELQGSDVDYTKEREFYVEEDG
jgi:hypothetical protein